MPSSASTVTASLLPIIDAIPDPFVVVDLQHRIVYANRAAALSARRDRQGMVGRLVTDIVPFARGKALVAALASATSSPEPVVIEEYVHETDRWYETTLIVEATTRALFSRDITVKKGALELAARLARHSSVRADVSAALTDSDEGVVLQECCESLVRHLKVAFARAWVISPDDTTLLLRASAGLYTHLDGAHGAVPVGQFKIGRIAATRQAHLSNEVATDSQIGDPAWAQREGMRAFAGYPLVVGDHLVGVLAMFSRDELPEDTLAALGSIADTLAHGILRLRGERELTARVEDLARSNAELEQFAYVASHDLQEPLRMIASYNQLLARRYQGKLGQDADEFIAFTVEGVTRMQRLINDLLAYSRVGTRQLTPREIPLEGVLATTLAQLGKALTEAGAEVTHDALPVVFGSETQLVQLLQNLIANAIKFHGERAPRVHLSAAPAGDGHVISVADNGIGIDAQYFDRIFVIFQRLHTRDRYPGTGIGLSICKKIVERHGGTLAVESKLGVGTTMRFTLPGRIAAS